MTPSLPSRTDAIESALHILDYGCDYGPYDRQATAVRDLITEHDRLRGAAEGLLTMLEVFEDLAAPEIHEATTELQAALEAKP